MKIDHIAIAVENLDEAVELYERTLGLVVTHRERVAESETETATFELAGAAIELVQGTSEESAIGKFIKARGPGLHHIAFAVEDVERTLADLKAKGVRLVDQTPRRGKGRSRVAFIHPESLGRVLCELVERAVEKPDDGA
jgi:methylmalonyl-CoA/ethylmalonyl-CoA epimerase